MMNDFLKQYFGGLAPAKPRKPLTGNVSDSRTVKKKKERQLILIVR